MHKYLVNQTQTHLGLLTGAIKIPIGAWAKISAEQADSDEISEVVRRGWATLSNKEPAAAVPFIPQLNIIEPPSKGMKEFPKG